MSAPEHAEVFVVRWWNPDARCWYGSREFRTLKGAERVAAQLQSRGCVAEVWRLSGEWRKSAS